MNVLDLFSGIGGFSLGLERAGMRTVAFCEIDPFCRRVLAKHWPSVPCYTDVRELTAARLAADGIAADVICGGFPCQDISLAGAGAGLEGERSGLWFEYARIISELRPRFVIVENVSALLGRGLDRVLGDLASLGFDAEWHCIPASAVGAPHRRDRIWIVAYPERDRLSIGWRASVALKESGKQRRIFGDERSSSELETQSVLADANSIDVQGVVCRRNDSLIRREQIERQARLCSGAGRDHDWSSEPAVGRVAHGIPDRVGQLKGFGNAVVPQIPEIIGRAILSQTQAAE